MKFSSRDRDVRMTAAVAAVILTTGLTACAANEPQIPVPEEVKSALTSLGSQPADLSIAHNIAWRACMQDKGFDVPFDSSAGGQRRSALIGVEGLFASEDDARAFGYSTTSSEGEGPIEAYQASLPASEQEKFSLASYGDGGEETLSLPGGVVVSRSAEGCLADADTAVYGSVIDAMQVSEFVNEANGQSSQFLDEAESKLSSVMGDYEGCMAGNGIDVSGLNAAEVAGSRFGQYRSLGQVPGEEEQTMAATDYQCQNEAGFNQTLDNVFVENASAWIVESEEHILAIRDLMDASMLRAQQVINGS